jgi:hypothetical protein
VELRPERDKPCDLPCCNPGRLLFETGEAVAHELEEMPADPVRLDEPRFALDGPFLKLRNLRHTAEITPLCE